ncbi:MAG: hypothetical protein CMF26_02290 [Kiloniella sp.]|nr:hypothetical protein [Kiloniella sp.]
MPNQLELTHDQINAFLKRYEIFEPVLAVDSGAFGNVNANYCIETQTRRLILQQVGRKKNLDQLRLSSHVSNTLFARDFLTPSFHLTDEGDPFIEHAGEQFRLMSFVSDPVLEIRPSVADALRIVALAEDLHLALNRYFRFVDEDDRRYMTSYQDQPDLIVQAAFARSDLSAVTRSRNDSVRPFLDATFEEPSRVRHCHGDIKFGNVIVTPRRIGLLDFENYNVQEWGWEIGDALRSWFSDQLDNMTWSIRAAELEAFLDQQTWFTKRDAVLHTLRTTAKLLVHLYTDREDGRYYFSSESEADRLEKVDVLISRHETFLPALLSFARERGHID